MTEAARHTPEAPREDWIAWACEMEAQRDVLQAALEKTRRALNLAVGMVMEHEPGDSRAVSDEAVALASVVCECDDQASWDVIDTALAQAADGKHRNPS